MYKHINCKNKFRGLHRGLNYLEGEPPPQTPPSTSTHQRFLDQPLTLPVHIPGYATACRPRRSASTARRGSTADEAAIYGPVSCQTRPASLRTLQQLVVSAGRSDGVTDAKGYGVSITVSRPSPEGAFKEFLFSFKEYRQATRICSSSSAEDFELFTVVPELETPTFPRRTVCDRSRHAFK